METTPAYLDPRSGATFPLAMPRWRGTSGAPLLLTPLAGIGRGGIDPAAPGLWRYAGALPFRPAEPITLGEGRTPLLARTVCGAKALLKCEFMMPSGSFKDRGSAVMLSLLREQGIGAVLEDSSGNGGASVAAYAAAGGLRATVMMPEATSPAKQVQVRAYGAEVVLVPGDRQTTAEAAAAATGHGFYASHAWHPFFLHGVKTLAYELFEDLGFEVPDAVVMPCGAGSNVLGLAIGFGELLRAGAIRRVPRLFAVQPEACAPVAAAFRAGRRDWVPAPIAPTIAEGTAIAKPLRLPEVVDALRASGGGVTTVSEDEIAGAVLAAARLGLYLEPTAAQALAGFMRLIGEETVAADARTVVLLTGSGLKATPLIADLLVGR